ncbi:hypothetical protein M427DRAFT_280755 [Gonapodya prolifera JEL478]|uniref:Uncharacterized protein n=1 Tax=Gonapodya prolifera (strain JEL478) TaxID=1344416 RepID=A0A139AYN8_GONPJ|nr:hypothetical protein M427DRAFT_280755 [Gonapodya prolifera JEL478]|eukprot:KXS21872.1 hypothetical protein M427DRAFT_280755 [Gonapodya prolifera JEL478]
MQTISRLGARLLLLLGLVAASKVAAAVTSRLSHRALILTNDNGGQDAPEQTFAGYEIPWDTLSIPQTGYSGNLPLFNTDGSPKYSLIVLTSTSLQYLNSSSGLYVSPLTTSQWSYLESYELTYSVRRVVLNDFPTSSEGTVSLGGTSEVQNVAVVADFANLAHMKSTGKLDTTGLYHYPANIYSPLPSNIANVTQCATLDPSASFPSTTTACVVVRYNNGREAMRFFLSFGWWSSTSLWLDHMWLAWGMRQLLPGWRRTIMLGQVDDLFLTTETTPTQTTASYDYRLTYADLQAVEAWMADLNTRLPTGSSFKLELCFNGDGVLEQIADTTDYYINVDTERYVDLEFIKPAGAKGEVRWPATFDTAWAVADLKGDALYKSLVEGGIASGNFYWTSHTFTHENFDNVSYSDITNELTVNYKMAGPTYLNLLGKPYWSNKTMVTPQISGLHNEWALKALTDFGIVGVVGDNSRPAITPSNVYDFWVSTTATSNYAGYTVIPRWPCHVYFFATTPAEIEYVYNVMYNTTLGISNWTQILEREGARQLQLFMSIRHDPTMFHQANLRSIDMPTVTVGGKTGQLSVLEQWMEKVLSVYLALVDWPVVSYHGDTLYDLYAERMTRSTCGASVSYDLVNNGDGTSSINTLYVTSSSNCAVRLTVPASVIVASGQTIEKIGNDFATIVVQSIAGTTQVVTLSEPITFASPIIQSTSTTTLSTTTTTSSTSTATQSTTGITTSTTTLSTTAKTTSTSTSTITQSTTGITTSATTLSTTAKATSIATSTFTQSTTGITSTVATTNKATSTAAVSSLASTSIQSTATTPTSPSTTQSATLSRTTTASAITSPCTSTTGYCVDTSTLLRTVSTAAGTYQVVVQVWTLTAKDLFVELHDTATGAIVSNYAYNSIAASTGSNYVNYTFAVTWPALPTTTSYNWFVWLTTPGGGWGAELWNQVIPVAIGTSPSTTTLVRSTTTIAAVTTSLASPCTAGATYCVDTTTLPLSVSSAAGTYSVTVKVWSKTALDAFVELHQTSNGALVSNYAYSSIPASTSSTYTSFTFAVTYSALTSPPYNWFVWITSPGAGWNGMLWNQV